MVLTLLSWGSGNVFPNFPKVRINRKNRFLDSNSGPLNEKVQGRGWESACLASNSTPGPSWGVGAGQAKWGTEFTQDKEVPFNLPCAYDSPRAVLKRRF